MKGVIWVLGSFSSDAQIKVEDFESRRDIIVKLVGTEEDLMVKYF